jgi:23S rRNA pseudouridine2457 synthase
MPTILFYKPYEVLSTFTDEGTGHATLKEYIPIPNIYAAGRLDFRSEGLLVLTDDGRLIHRLADPKHHIEKTYYAQVEGVPTPQALAILKKGVVLKEFRALPAQARIIPDPDLPPRSKPITPHGPTAWLEIRLREGKKHQVRLMTNAVGLPTLRLVRVAIGPLTLGELQPGEWREVNGNELNPLWK